MYAYECTTLNVRVSECVVSEGRRISRLEIIIIDGPQ